MGHTTYTRNNMGQKCEESCGLWVLNEVIKKENPENLKKQSWKPFGIYQHNLSKNGLDWL